MLPLQPYPAINELFATKVLTELSSEQYGPPDLAQPGNNRKGREGNDGVLDGAKNIIKIQNTISGIPDVTGTRLYLFKCNAWSEQRVGMHLDDLTKGGKVISTAVLQGNNMIRVGHHEFPSNGILRNCT